MKPSRPKTKKPTNWRSLSEADLVKETKKWVGRQSRASLELARGLAEIQRRAEKDRKIRERVAKNVRLETPIPRKGEQKPAPKPKPALPPKFWRRVFGVNDFVQACQNVLGLRIKRGYWLDHLQGGIRQLGLSRDQADIVGLDRLEALRSVTNYAEGQALAHEIADNPASHDLVAVIEAAAEIRAKHTNGVRFVEEKIQLLIDDTNSGGSADWFHRLLRPFFSQTSAPAVAMSYALASAAPVTQSIRAVLTAAAWNQMAIHKMQFDSPTFMLNMFARVHGGTLVWINNKEVLHITNQDIFREFVEDEPVSQGTSTETSAELTPTIAATSAATEELSTNLPEESPA